MPDAPVADAERDPPDLDRLARSFEDRRLAARAGAKRRVLPASVFVLIVGAALAFAAFAVDIGPVAMIGLLPAGPLALWWQQQPVRAYARTVKEEAYPAAIRQLGADWRFERGGGLDLRSLRPFGILPGHDRARQEDLITGRHAGIDVAMVEATLTEQRSSGKHQRTVTTFDGLIVRFVLPEPPGLRLVLRRRFRGAPFFSGLERVRLETSDFEREFNVYADDQVAARVLLTVTVMERLFALSDDLMRLGGGARAERLEASLVGDRLLVLVPCKTDLFEPNNVRRSLHVREDLERLIARVRDVLRIAEALGLSR